MSGEMNTSLGNGITNYLILRFLCHLKGDDNPGIGVEGDDGIIGTHVELTQADFARVGLTCQLVSHDDVSTSSFCGIQFDFENEVNITDPIKVILKTPLVNRKYLGAGQKVVCGLLKSKALSLLWQYPGAPIISVYARRLFELVKHFDLYFNEEEFRDYHFKGLDIKNENYPWKEIKLSTRFLMSKLYNIDLQEQYELEDYFSNLDLVPMYSHPIIDKFITKTQRDFFERFHLELDQNEKLIDYAWEDIPVHSQCISQVRNLVRQVATCPVSF